MTRARHIEPTQVQYLKDRFESKYQRTDGCWIWSGAKVRGYGYIYHKNYAGLYAHRVSYLLYVGTVPEGMLVDHICHVRSCVNPSHLRLATPKQNTENVSGLRSTNTSGYQGVTKREKSGKWRATICHRERTIFLGSFDTAEEADQAARSARNRMFSHNLIDRKGVA